MNLYTRTFTHAVPNFCSFTLGHVGKSWKDDPSNCIGKLNFSLLARDSMSSAMLLLCRLISNARAVEPLLSSSASRDNDGCLLHELAAASRIDKTGDMAAKRESVCDGRVGPVLGGE